MYPRDQKQEDSKHLLFMNYPVSTSPPISAIHSLFWGPFFLVSSCNVAPTSHQKSQCSNFPCSGTITEKGYQILFSWTLNLEPSQCCIEAGGHIHHHVSIWIKPFLQYDRNCGSCSMAFSNFHSSWLFSQCSFKNLQLIPWTPNIHSINAIFPKRGRLMQTYQEYSAAKSHSRKHEKFGTGCLTMMEQ